MKKKKKTYAEQYLEMKNKLNEMSDELRKLNFEKRHSSGDEAEKIGKQIEQVEKVFQETLEKSKKLELLAMVETKVEEFRGYLPVGKEIIDMTRDEISEVVKIFANLLIKLQKDLDPEIAEFTTLHAKHLFRKWKAYTDAGFPVKIATSILLSEIKPIGFSEILSKGMDVMDKGMENAGKSLKK